MIIDAALGPAEIDLLPRRDLRETVCVVFDVLRATSSIITALAHGADEIWPVRTIDEALALKRIRPAAVLGGERHGELIEGFALGNSPLEYRRGDLRQIITTTTNGTIALRACENSAMVLPGALLNIAALRRMIEAVAPPHLLLVAAGTFRDVALEDVFAAGLLARDCRAAVLTDAAETMAAVADKYTSDPLRALRNSCNGRALLAKSRSDEIAWCAQVSRFDVTGAMQDGVIRPASPVPFGDLHAADGTLDSRFV